MRLTRYPIPLRMRGEILILVSYFFGLSSSPLLDIHNLVTLVSHVT
jgi:hypothetical protein